MKRVLVQNNVPTDRVSGTYQGVALGHIVFPPRYEPNPQAKSSLSNSAYISCP